ncbi:hypothetical protein EDC50_2935 [Vulcaniibacterium tengchongense]|uniref:Uncharacterized protein n=1 Tax=Vulcaniibacterium tengchongense TaxID=1273429 RepID=A0A3N4VNZ3_9GAMM|nr:hypothetical protein EDC50_2935 [Vulcaniibacterium tengchongense]
MSVRFERRLPPRPDDAPGEAYARPPPAALDALDARPTFPRHGRSLPAVGLRPDAARRPPRRGGPARSGIRVRLPRRPRARTER